jgi:hypothetical protein
LIHIKNILRKLKAASPDRDDGHREDPSEKSAEFPLDSEILENNSKFKKRLSGFHPSIHFPLQNKILRIALIAIPLIIFIIVPFEQFIQDEELKLRIHIALLLASVILGIWLFAIKRGLEDSEVQEYDEATLESDELVSEQKIVNDYSPKDKKPFLQKLILGKLLRNKSNDAPAETKRTFLRKLVQKKTTGEQNGRTS